MSETVHYRGIARKVAQGKADSEAYAQKYYNDKGQDIPDYCDTAIEAITMEGYGDTQLYFYYYERDELYKFIDVESVEVDEDIVRGKYIDNGTIEFEVKYYNGGAGFEELVSEVLDKLHIIENREVELTKRPMHSTNTLCTYTKSGESIKEGHILGYGDNYPCLVMYDRYEGAFKAIEFGYMKDEGYLLRDHELTAYTNTWTILGHIDNEDDRELLKDMPQNFSLDEHYRY